MDFTIGGTTQNINGGASRFAGTFDSDNTVVFSGLSGANFTITGNTSSPASHINGVIIESIPEPGTGFLSVLAASLLLVRRRK